MCVLVVHLQQVPDYPVVVGANRDEAFARPSAPPALDPDGRYFAPTDLQAGGTWLGINRRGLFAAITNRSGELIAPDRPSRGALCRLALAADSAAEAIARVTDEIHRAPRNGFNLLVADGQEAFVLSGLEALDHHRLEAGTHVLTNLHEPDSFDPGCPPPTPDIETTLAALAVVCRDHRDRDGYQVCKHRDEHGTVSSALIGIAGGTHCATRFLFADGPPCRTPYVDLSRPVSAWRAI